MKRKIIIFIVLTCLTALPYLSIGATFDSGGNVSDSGIGNSGSKIPNPLGNGSKDIFQFIGQVLDALAPLGAALVVFFVIYSGFLFVTAQGNEEKLKKAKNALLWTLVGAAIVLGAKVIAEAIKNTITQLQQ